MFEMRNQFTFYRSYWEAMKGLGKRDRQAILEAVIGYALDGQITEGMSSLQQAMFSLIRPTLDSGRRKAKYGKLGAEAKAKLRNAEPASQPAKLSCISKKEIEIEKEIELELEGEREKEKDKRNSLAAPAPEEERAFASFWAGYPSKIGKQAAWRAWEELAPDSAAVEKIMEALECWKASQRWQEEGGRYVPRAAKWLSEGHWLAPPEPAAGTSRSLDAEEQEAIRRMMEEDNDAGTP